MSHSNLRLHGSPHGHDAYEGLIANVKYKRPNPTVCFVVSGTIVEAGR